MRLEKRLIVMQSFLFFFLTPEALQKYEGRIEVKTSTSDIAMEALKSPSLRSRRDEHIFKLVRKCTDGWRPQFLRIILF